MKLEQMLLASHQVRKSRRQKDAFYAFVQEQCNRAGIAVQRMDRAGARNIVMGDVEHARVIFAAHYDTCAVLPFPNFITPKNCLFYILYSLVLGMAFFILCAALAVGLTILGLGAWAPLAGIVFCWSLILLMFFGPANRHTANDNTSGTALVLRLALELAPALRNQAAFVLFDGEELGLIGSTAFASKNRKVRAGTLVINFDCIGVGEALMFCPRKGALRDSDYELLCQAARQICSAQGRTLLLERPGTAFYPSDQMAFQKGVGVAALKHSRVFGYYMDDIHTRRDRVLDTQNLDILQKICEMFLQKIAQKG